ncbi:MAG: hypothetical protein E7013_03945 [Alphaproteobacteria bacterium]|nr:hypothetical protein [Alphaproteobacteria bacterium]
MRLVMFSFSLNANEVRIDMDYPRPKEKIAELRQEFHHGIRPIFLKYLPLADPKAVSEKFSQEEQKLLLSGKVPPGWSVHHQKSLSWGGQSFNVDLLEEIERIPLTPEQIQICERALNTEKTRRHFQIENFLQNAIRKKTFPKAFRALFKNYLILLPQEIHEKLEKEYLKVQRDIGFSIKTENKDTPELALKLPLSFPLWDQYILGGSHLNVQAQKPIYHSREDYRKKRLFRHQNAALRHMRLSDRLKDD